MTSKAVTAVPVQDAGLRGGKPWRMAIETVSRAWHDRILGLSAEAAFWQLLSVPPLVLALLGGLGYFGGLLGPDTVNRIERRILALASGVAAPEVVDTVIRNTLDEVLQRGRADIVSIGFIISLWAGSSAMATFVNTITIAYGMRDLRGAVRSRLLALWLYLVSIAVLSVLLPLLVIGPTELRRITPTAWRHAADDAIQIGYWPVVGGLLLMGLGALYHYATPVRLLWRRAFPGAALALLVFVLGSAGLRLYIRVVVGKALTYGALAAPIAALLFFYVLALAVLIGAELNATLERLWPRGPKATQMARIRSRLANGADEPPGSGR
ncbi:MAG: YihY/virulence factor BrkB family protein [Pseudonocardiales bacterium]